MFFYRIRKRAFSFNTETYLKAQHFWRGSVRTKLCPTIFSPTWQLNISELNRRFYSFTLTSPPCSSSWLFERARPSTIFQLTHSTHVKLPTWTHPPCYASSKLSHLMTLPPIPDTSSLPFTLITLVLKPLFHFVSLLIITTFSSCSTNGSYCTTATRYLGGDFSLLLCMGGSIGLLEACKALWLTVILSCTNEQCLIWFLNLQMVNKHYKFEIWECITTQIQPQHNLVLPHI